jgi:XTP/dITP diphosphohydrolase
MLAPLDFKPVELPLREPQGDNQEEIVRSKVLIAFSMKRAPLFVDHTGLFVEAWNDFPGGLSRELWDKLGAEGFLRLLACENNRQALARTLIGYCDAYKIYIFEGQLRGILARELKDSGGGWDALFIPGGHTTPLAGMEPEDRLEMCMRWQAAEKFKAFVRYRVGERR